MYWAQGQKEAIQHYPINADTSRCNRHHNHPKGVAATLGMPNPNSRSSGYNKRPRYPNKGRSGSISARNCSTINNHQ